MYAIKPLLLFVGISGLFIFFSCDQPPKDEEKQPPTTTMEHHMLGMTAAVSNVSKSTPVTALAGSGTPDTDALQYHLALGYNEHCIDTFKVRLRNYQLKGQAGDRAVVGPYLQANPNSQVRITVQNQLPFMGNGKRSMDLVYHFYMPWQDNDTLQKLIEQASNKGKVTINLNNYLKTAQSKSFWASLDSLRKFDRSCKAGNSSIKKKTAERIVNDYKWPDDMTGKPFTLHTDLNLRTDRTLKDDSVWRLPRNDGSTYYLVLDRNVKDGKLIIKVFLEQQHHHHDDGQHSNTPHQFNYSNLHTHGWHVSPRQDNIFVSIPPQKAGKPAPQYTYQYDLKEHPAGTFWYHPHVHGSTSLQVASGASGPLVVRDHPDDLAKYPALATASQPAREEVLVLNQILLHPEIHELPDFTTLMNLQAIRGYLVCKGLNPGTTINGKSQPVISCKQGQTKRLRFINSGFNDNIMFRFPDEVEVIQIATDGIYLYKPRKTQMIAMAPGNRVDVIIRPKTNAAAQTYPVHVYKYQVNCEYFPSKKFNLKYDHPCTYDKTDKDGILTHLNITKGTTIEDELPDSNGLPKPFERISDTMITSKPRQDIQFKKMGGNPTTYTINDESYEGPKNRKQIIQLRAGAYQAWKYEGSGHPFHIHVNPFMVYKVGSHTIEPPVWKDVAYSGGDDILWRTYYDPRFTGQFVIHCHILDHEDQGMMRDVIVLEPDATLQKVALPDTCRTGPCPNPPPSPFPNPLPGS